MTIAAGILATDGVLLFSDSQLTGWEKTFKRKLFDLHCGATMGAMAISGDADHARSAIEDCQDALNRNKAESIRDVRVAIRRTIGRMLEDYKKADLDQNQKPEFVLAIASPSEHTVRLFSCHDRAIAPVEHYEFRGTGAYLANYVMGAFGPSGPVSLRETVPIALHILNATKEHDAHVGGGSQFIVLRSNSEQSGQMSSTGILQYRFNAEESGHISHYEYWCGALLSAIGNPLISADELRSRTESFSNMARSMHAAITNHGTHYRALFDTLCPTP